MKSQASLYHCRFLTRENDSCYFTGKANDVCWAVEVPDAGPVTLVFGAGDLSLVSGRFGFENQAPACDEAKEEARKFLLDGIQKSMVERVDAERGWMNAFNEPISPTLSGKSASCGVRTAPALTPTV